MSPPPYSSNEEGREIIFILTCIVNIFDNKEDHIYSAYVQLISMSGTVDIFMNEFTPPRYPEKSS